MFFFDLTILRMGSLQCTQIWDQLRVYNKNHLLLTCLRQQIKIWLSLKDKAYQRKFTSRFYHHDYSNTIIDFIIKYFVNIRFAFNLHTNIHNVKHDITKMKCQWLKFSFKTEFHLNWHFSFKIQTNTNNHLFRIISYTTLHLKKNQTSNHSMILFLFWIFLWQKVFQFTSLAKEVFKSFCLPLEIVLVPGDVFPLLFHC